MILLKQWFNYFLNFSICDGYVYVLRDREQEITNFNPDPQFFKFNPIKDLRVRILYVRL